MVKSNKSANLGHEMAKIMCIADTNRIHHESTMRKTRHILNTPWSIFYNVRFRVEVKMDQLRKCFQACDAQTMIKNNYYSLE